MGDECNGCVGRGTGTGCCMCNKPIPVRLRTQTEVDRPRRDCDGCRNGRIHTHR